MTEDSLWTHYERAECTEDCLHPTLFIGSKLEIQCIHKFLHMTSLFASLAEDDDHESFFMVNNGAMLWSNVLVIFT
jgi:hypothetical protein